MWNLVNNCPHNLKVNNYLFEENVSLYTYLVLSDLGNYYWESLLEKL